VGASPPVVDPHVGFSHPPTLPLPRTCQNASELFRSSLGHASCLSPTSACHPKSAACPPCPISRADLSFRISSPRSSPVKSPLCSVSLFRRFRVNNVHPPPSPLFSRPSAFPALFTLPDSAESYSARRCQTNFLPPEFVWACPFCCAGRFPPAQNIPFSRSPAATLPYRFWMLSPIPPTCRPPPLLWLPFQTLMRKVSHPSSPFSALWAVPAVALLFRHNGQVRSLFDARVQPLNPVHNALFIPFARDVLPTFLYRVPAC